MNLGYAVVLLFKNKSWSSFQVPSAGNAYKWAILAGLFWFAALGIYGQGAALMGTMGPIVGWPMLLGLSLIISNIWAVRSGEWKEAKKPFQLMLIGLGIIILATSRLLWCFHPGGMSFKMTYRDDKTVYFSPKWREAICMRHNSINNLLFFVFL